MSGNDIIRTVHEDGGWKFEAKLSGSNRIRGDAKATFICHAFVICTEKR